MISPEVKSRSLASSLIVTWDVHFSYLVSDNDGLNVGCDCYTLIMIDYWRVNINV